MSKPLQLDHDVPGCDAKPATVTLASRPPTPTYDGHRHRVPAWSVLVVCCIAQFMVVLDVSIVNVALPQMRASLHLSPTSQQWVINAYTLTFAGLLLLGGRAGDLFGRRRVFLFGLGLFTAFSLAGGLAQSGGWLIAARALQGVGSAILAPATLSLLTTAFPDPNSRRRALGVWSATAASGAALGVLGGGVLTDLLDWRWVLFVNVPIGAALLAGAAWALSESRLDGITRDLDVAGAVSVTAGLAVLVYGVVSTDTHPWASTRTIGTLTLGAALLGAFVLIESRVAEHPLVPFGVFRRRSLTAANTVSVAVGAALFSLFYFLSLYLQEINGYTPLRAGIAFLPLGLSILTGALSAPRLIPRLGLRRQLVLGLLLTACGTEWMAQLTPSSGYWSAVLGPELLAGIGLGISFVPLTLAATAGVPPHQAGLAAGLLNTTRQIGGAVVLAAMATAAAAMHSDSTAHHAVAAVLTSGYDRAFTIGAGILVAGSLAALILPPQPDTARTSGPALGPGPTVATSTAPDAQALSTD
jgi:EmrB/QacA subfamily drug resistance transporter